MSCLFSVQNVYDIAISRAHSAQGGYGHGVVFAHSAHSWNELLRALIKGKWGKMLVLGMGTMGKIEKKRCFAHSAHSAHSYPYNRGRIRFGKWGFISQAHAGGQAGARAKSRSCASYGEGC